jgi:hypothetical protein
VRIPDAAGLYDAKVPSLARHAERLPNPWQRRHYFYYLTQYFLPRYASPPRPWRHK